MSFAYIYYLQRRLNVTGAFRPFSFGLVTYTRLEHLPIIKNLLILHASLYPFNLGQYPLIYQCNSGNNFLSTAGKDSRDSVYFFLPLPPSPSLFFFNFEYFSTATFFIFFFRVLKRSCQDISSYFWKVRNFDRMLYFWFSIKIKMVMDLLFNINKIFHSYIITSIIDAIWKKRATRERERESKMSME